MMSMVDILLKENADLQAGYDAARLEIASLKAQPYDQQAMGLCHVCGWKGVIDYPDGPVCVACEHDKALSPQPTAQALHVAATSCPHEIDKDKIVLHFDSKQPGKNALAQLAARLQAAQAQVVPAPGVEAVSEREFKQFLSDVLTAAGLVTHGKKCKDFGRRLGEMSMRLRTAPKTAAAPAQAGEYPELPDLESAFAPFWSAILGWRDAVPGKASSEAAREIEKLVAAQMRAYVDADRAARGSAQAAPVDAAVLRDAERWMKLEAEAVREYVGFNDIWYGSAEDLRHGVDQLPATYAARAAQKGGA